jgi:demethylspheroidene O-methyltransferase
MTAPLSAPVSAPLSAPVPPVTPLTPPRAAPGGWRARWRERWCDWRNRQVADPGFQRRAAASWFTRPVVRKQAGELFDLMAGFVYTQVLLSCVRLQLFDLLARGPLPVARIAAATGLELAMAQRLCAAAAALELLDLRADGAYALGRLGAPLVGNAALHAMIEHHATLYADLADPVALLRGTSQPAMAGYWPYAAVDAPPAARQTLSAERVAEYSRLMSASQPLVAQEVLAAYAFHPHRCLLDVGGGEGRFLAAVAAQAPQLQLMLFDLPGVASRAQNQLAAAGLGDRTQVHGGDFFQDELPRGADIVSLIRVAFDHPDDRVLRLLRAARRALPDDGTLLLAEPMAGVAGAEAMGDAYFGFYLLAMGHGRPRTAQELGALLEAAGFGDVQQRRLNLPLQTGLLVARCRPT